MAQIDLGKLKFNWKGAWATATAYEVDDVVSYGGASFVVVHCSMKEGRSRPKFVLTKYNLVVGFVYLFFYSIVV